MSTRNPMTSLSISSNYVPILFKVPPVQVLSIPLLKQNREAKKQTKVSKTFGLQNKHSRAVMVLDPKKMTQGSDPILVEFSFLELSSLSRITLIKVVITIPKNLLEWD